MGSWWLSIRNLPAMQEPQETRVLSLGREDPLEKGMVMHSSILVWGIPWRGAWRATVHGIVKSQTQLKRLSTHLSICMPILMWNMYFCFIEYAKAFDCVDHNKLWKILKEMGVPDHLTYLLRNLYTGQEATVRTGHGTTDWFQIGKGVCQGCILSLLI